MDLEIPDVLTNAVLINPQKVSNVDKPYYEGYILFDGELEISARIYQHVLDNSGLFFIHSSARLTVQGKYNVNGGFYYVNKLVFDQLKAPFQVDVICISEDEFKQDNLVFSYEISEGVFAEQSLSKKFTNLASLNENTFIRAQIGKKNKYSKFPIERFLLDEEKVQRVAELVSIEEVDGKSKLWLSIEFEECCKFLVSVSSSTLKKESEGFSYKIGEKLLSSTQFDGRYLKTQWVPDEFSGTIYFIEESNKLEAEYWLFKADKLLFPVKILKSHLFLLGILSVDKGAQLEVEIKLTPEKYQTVNYWEIKNFINDPIKNLKIAPNQSYTLNVAWNWNEFSSDVPFKLTHPNKSPFFYSKPAFLTILYANNLTLVVALSAHLLRFKQVKFLNQGESLACQLKISTIQLSLGQQTPALTVTKIIRLPERPKQNFSILETWLKCESVETKVITGKERGVAKFVDKTIQIEPYTDWNDLFVNMGNPMDYEYFVRMKKNKARSTVIKILEAKKLI